MSASVAAPMDITALELDEGIREMERSRKGEPTQPPEPFAYQ